MSLLFFLGSRVPIDKTIKKVELPKEPKELDKFLKESEQKFDDITPGTEKAIIWANSLKKQKTKIAIVYIHGFSSTKKDTYPLCENIAKNLKANLFHTRLTGHGRGSKVLAEASVNDWINDTYEAFEIGRRIGEKVIIISFSTGSALTMWLATEVQKMNDDVVALVFISPNFSPKQPISNVLLWPWGKTLAKIIIGSNRSWEPINPQQGEYWTTSYPVEALLPMMGTVKIAREAKVENIRQPVLMIFSQFEQVVNTKKTESIFSRLGNTNQEETYIKEIIYINKTQDPYNHIIVGDIVSPMNNEIVTQSILNFISSLL
ncbi:alpha/beta hydrolase (plasmid) [Nostoc sp. C057]|uniref:alpha/beta hydrolase n=1 Tax=Nostoc sp. C057 TaxID=2576903 RepID=UPI0015C31B8B